MSLRDFIQKLQEQDDNDVIYSKVPEQSIKIIPPVQTTKNIELNNNIRIIPPESKYDEPKKQPTTIKFKLNIIKTDSKKETDQVEQKQTQQQKVIEKKQEQKIEKPIQLTEEQKIEQLFRQSGTSRNKRDVWYDYYNKAKLSRKQNSVVAQMKKGKFAITVDNQVLILPDYDVVNKTTSEILMDKWL